MPLDISAHGGNFGGGKPLKSMVNGAAYDYAIASSALSKGDICSVAKYDALTAGTQVSVSGLAVPYSDCKFVLYVGGTLFITVIQPNTGGLQVCLVNVNNVTVTILQTYVLSTSYNPSSSYAVLTPDKTKLVITGRSNNTGESGYTKVDMATIDTVNNVLTFGATYTVDTANSISSQTVQMLSNTQGIVCGYNSGNYLYGMAFTINADNSITFGTFTKIGTSTASNGIVIAAVNSSTFIAIVRQYNGSYPWYYLVRISGNTLTISSEFTMSAYSSSWPGYRSTASRVYKEDANYYYVTVLFNGGSYYNNYWKFQVPKDITKMTLSLIANNYVYDSNSSEYYGLMDFMPNCPNDAFRSYMAYGSTDYAQAQPFSTIYMNSTSISDGVKFTNFQTAITNPVGSYPGACAYLYNNNPRIIHLIQITGGMEFIIQDIVSHIKPFTPTGGSTSAPLYAGVPTTDLASGASGKITMLS